MGKKERACASTKDHQHKEWVIDIPNIREHVFWQECCIYKVPSVLRKLNKEAYTPQLISIGPLHHGNKQLAEMEKQKSIYLSDFVKRTEVTRTKETWENFVSILKRNEESIRHCYAENSELCSVEYVKMILFDCVFVIELFIRDYEKRKHGDDYVINRPWLKNGTQQDLLLLENQIPYFVLNKLYESAFPANHQPTFHDLTCKYFRNYKPRGITTPDQKKVLHFTDLLRHFLSAEHPTPKETSSIKNLYSATKLREAGIRFKGLEKECLTDITFEKGNLICCKRGTLKMPQFEVYDTTECVIRNLMALEQCYYPSETYICNYISLMDYLINTANDVDLLVEKGVIVNWIGSSEAVAKLVNKLCINITESNFCYHDICAKVNEYHMNRCNRVVNRLRIAMETLRSVYFTDIWRGTSTVAAVILLGLTLIQTICSVRALPPGSRLV